LADELELAVPAREQGVVVLDGDTVDAVLGGGS